MIIDNRSIIEVKWAFFLIDQRFVIIHTFCGSITPEKRSFLRISKRKFRRAKHIFWVRFRRVFSIFRWNHWGRCCPIMMPKRGVGKISFFALFTSYDYFGEENACFINSQRSTACQKWTRQVIKISTHPFFSGVKTATDMMLIASSRSNPTGTWLVNLGTLGNTGGAIFGKP